jgi:hypothetical protein
VAGDGQVQADADYRPAVLRARLDQDAGELALFDEDVVGPLDAAAEARRLVADRLAVGRAAGRELLGCFADG